MGGYLLIQTQMGRRGEVLSRLAGIAAVEACGVEGPFDVIVWAETPASFQEVVTQCEGCEGVLRLLPCASRTASADPSPVARQVAPVMA